MIKEDCAHSEIWDYEGWRKTQDRTPSDWIRTVTGKINIVSSLIIRAGHMGNNPTIHINQMLEGLLCLTGYYNKRTNKFDNKKVIIDNTLDKSIIFLSNHDVLMNIRFIPEFIKTTKDGSGKIKIKLPENCTPEQIDDYKKSVKGYIEIKNYV